MGAVPVGTAAGRATEYPMNLLSISHESSFAPAGISPNSFRSDIYRSAYYCKATRLTRYRSPEESISPSAKPSPTPPLDPYSVRTQSTEASPTYVTTPPLPGHAPTPSPPSISHQIWCSNYIKKGPSCYGERRTKYDQSSHLSGSRSSPLPLLTPLRVVPNVRHLPQHVHSNQQTQEYA